MTTTALPQLRLRLPGSWWQVPLHDRDEARASVRRLVAVQLGVSDDRARARVDVERRLLEALEDAIAGEGQAFHVALSIVPGVTLPVSALVALPDQQLTPAIGTDAATTMSVLAQGLANVTDGGTEAVHRFQAGRSEVARRVRHRTTTNPDGPEELTTVAVEYWMTVPGTKRFVLVTFTGPSGELEGPLTGLFDQIVRASTWTE